MYLLSIKYRSWQTAEIENYTENNTMNWVKIQTDKFIIKTLKHIKAILQGVKGYIIVFCRHIVCALWLKKYWMYSSCQQIKFDHDVLKKISFSRRVIENEDSDSYNHKFYNTNRRFDQQFDHARVWLKSWKVAEGLRAA